MFLEGIFLKEIGPSTGRYYGSGTWVGRREIEPRLEVYSGKVMLLRASKAACGGKCRGKKTLATLVTLINSKCISIKFAQI